MITFADDHEAELWRACIARALPTAMLLMEALLTADTAVLEYRKRCAPPAKKPDINPGCIACDPSFPCWASAEPCVKVASRCCDE